MKKLLTIVTAASIGYVAGILMAPKSGKETRKDLSDKADKFKETAAKKAEEAKVVYNESAEKVKQGASEIGVDAEALAKKARSSVDHISKEAARFGSEAKKHIGHAANTASRTTRSVGKSVNKLR